MQINATKNNGKIARDFSKFSEIKNFTHLDLFFKKID